MQTLMNLKERTQWIIGYIAKKNELSNAKIGGAVGSKPDSIRKYRSGQAVPRLNFLQKFCDCFGVDFQWLSKGTGVPFPGQDIRYDEASDVLGPETETVPVPETAAVPETTSETPGAREAHALEPGGGPEENPSSLGESVDCEMSFQKLAVLAGIRIDNEWIFHLSKKVGVESWKISLSIYHQQMDGSLVQRIEDCGYERHAWLVASKAGKAAPAKGGGGLNISQLLKITEEVLRSNTIHSASLSLNILSLKELINQKAAAPVMGTQAVIFSRKDANRMM